MKKILKFPFIIIRNIIVFVLQFIGAILTSVASLFLVLGLLLFYIKDFKVIEMFIKEFKNKMKNG